jgi:hypothetical protein
MKQQQAYQIGQAIAPITQNDLLATFPVAEFVNFKVTLKGMTQHNAHGLALEYIARRFKFTKYVQAFSHINSLSSLEGSLLPCVREVRDYYHAEMKKLITRYYGASVAAEIEECL